MLEHKDHSVTFRGAEEVRNYILNLHGIKEVEDEEFKDLFKGVGVVSFWTGAAKLTHST